MTQVEKETNAERIINRVQSAVFGNSEAVQKIPALSQQRGKAANKAIIHQSLLSLTPLGSMNSLALIASTRHHHSVYLKLTHTHTHIPLNSLTLGFQTEMYSIVLLKLHGNQTP